MSIRPSVFDNKEKRCASLLLRYSVNKFAGSIEVEDFVKSKIKRCDKFLGHIADTFAIVNPRGNLKPIRFL